MAAKKARAMSNDTNHNAVTVPAPERKTVEPEIHPVLAEVLAQKESDTVSWVKG